MHDPDDQARQEDNQICAGGGAGRSSGEFAGHQGLFGATYVSFASAEIAERLAGSVAGTILPLLLNGESQLELIADPSLREANELFFNAARLERSVALNTGDYLAIAKPRMEPIAEEARQDT